MTATLSFDVESPSWLRSLRWMALFGMAAAVMGAKLYGVNAGWMQVNAALVLLASWNFCLPMLESHFFHSTECFAFLQLLIDLLTLTVILWWSGGLVNPFASFYIFHVMIAGLLLNKRYTRIVSLTAAALVLLLTKAPSLVVRGHAVHLRDAPLWEGIPTGMLLLIFFTNIFILAFLTRLGKAQEERRQRAKMDALGRLVGGLAHEIGTPLNSILVLAKDLAESLPAEQKKDAATIHDQAQRCGDIVSLLLGYSRGLANMHNLQYTKRNLRTWIGAVYEELASHDSKKNQEKVDFLVDIIGLPDEVEIPELILRQVLVNLLKNSRDAVSGVEYPRIHVQVSSDKIEKELCFKVVDNGPGFSKEIRERAFEAFFSTKKHGEGAGLGLYISYYLLEQVGGRIVIDDGAGVGAIVRVGLPHSLWKEQQT